MTRALEADTALPNDTDWATRHNAAIHVPQAGFEMAMVPMLNGWLRYANTHHSRYSSFIGDDGVLGPEWEAIGDALRGLLNGELGRLDAGTLDGFILNTMRHHGIDTANK